MSSPRFKWFLVALILVSCLVFCGPLFICWTLFIWPFALFIFLPITASDYPFEYSNMMGSCAYVLIPTLNGCVVWIMLC